MRSRVRKAGGLGPANGQGGLPPWPALVAATLPKGRAVSSPYGEPSFTESLIKALAGDSVIVLDSPHGDLVPERSLLLARGDVLFGCTDTAEARAALLCDGLNVFKVAGAADRLFGASYGLPVEPWLEPVVAAREEIDWVRNALDILAKRQVEILKVDESEEERLVYGIVLEPDGVDAQDDTIDAREIRTAAHKFMQEYGNVGLQHQTFINGKARILESFIAPVDMMIGDQSVRKGTWIMAMRVLCDDIWKAVKSGLITGFSIGGSAVRKPDLAT